MKQKTMKGTLSLTSRGFGFVATDNETTVLVPVDHLLTAMGGDRVEVEPFPEASPERPAGRIVRVLDRSADPVVGRVIMRERQLRVRAHGNRVSRLLAIDPGSAETKPGDVVEAELVRWENPEVLPVVRITRILAGQDDADGELALIAMSRGFDLQFTDDVETAARRIKIPGARKKGGRRDLRQTVCFTIDPETAKDFDDALSIAQRKDGLFELGVHIADVTAFVEAGDTVDREASRRATSVYLVNHVLPMLPESLSNGLCSLVPDEDRLAMSVIATVDSQGRVHETRIHPSTIRSRRRFTYQEAEAIIGGKPDSLAPQIHLLHLLSRTLRTRREEGGSVDFDFTTPQIRVDEDGVPVEIIPSQRLNANRMIEECMLLANRLIAEHLRDSSSLPGVYRVHPEPNEQDVKELADALSRFGIEYTAGTSADDFRIMLSIVQNFTFRDIVETMASKALSKAFYTTKNCGHFGLGMEAYTHFTSPIRRYADVMVHRLVKHSLGYAKLASRDSKGMQAQCDRSNERERAATQAEREFTRMKGLEFLQTRIGHSYAGVVSGVASIGIFVEIERYLIDGLVHISQLGRDRFDFDRENYRLVGQKTGAAFTVGDSVEVTVKAVDLPARTASFVLSK